ncbi:holo-ACP synthase [Candidatus Dependentiae bacterium]
MILGIGTDIAKVARFKSWQNYSQEQLLKVFSKQELKNCKKNSEYNLEYLASRFSAKEAFFKALSQALVKIYLTKKTFTFIFTCQNIEIIKTTWDVPILKINWQAFEQIVDQKLSDFKVDLSISHEKEYAVSFVVISN